MPIDEIEARLASQTWQERVQVKPHQTALTLTTQYRGNRVVSHFYPEHWAKVQIARWTAARYGVVDVA
jgi:uncharacterized membrane protein